MKILAAVDRSDFADRVVSLVKRISSSGPAEVLLLNVAPREPDLLGQQLVRKEITDPVPEELKDRMEQLDRLAATLTNAGVVCRTRLVRGKPSETILDEAKRWDADLIIVGSQGRGMIYRQFLGSVSRRVLESRKYPVLVVPLDGDTEGTQV